MNVTSHPLNVTSQGKCLRNAQVTQVVFPVLYTVLFVIGAILNLLAVKIFSQIPSHTTFTVLLKNILVADLLMTLTFPFKILSASQLAPWQVRWFVCRFSAVMFYSTMYISITLLGLISFDRFLKITRPFSKSCLRKARVSKFLCAAVWAIIFLISLPNVILSNKKATKDSVKKCVGLKGPAGLKWHVISNYICQFIFWAVCILMVVLYTTISRKVYQSYKRSKSTDSKTQRKTKAKVFVIVSVFFVCFAPYHFVRVPYTLSQVGHVKECWKQNMLYYIKETTLWLCSSNICLDPLIYIYLCHAFRQKLRKRIKHTGTTTFSRTTQSMTNDNEVTESAL
ncbi:P2Y purinoceptor 13-like [Scyliorhinus canicula]|uniref:P2Y purinoceptor 13-like n=1 Tax=Scyliorhinus canicula TaxID=7830 RepID=UPI0018F4C75C|nr:P2Y purinoceptor 13-like [Scyliorhinus canicula]XP_038671529.1 P2Y purinoceptor 13-like [Scyliorhinus canicula]XP_038671530.1 P2Y purinoceptor 13-like [Scyliorhinus canicula]XP_038671531.1 P2Y purinoceptor 13-like [Scyliorhinus canicula]XP_038671532.1 P2Y purinoceptor 13-like [Scyliorhinus canicula]